MLHLFSTKDPDVFLLAWCSFASKSVVLRGTLEACLDFAQSLRPKPEPAPVSLRRAA